MELNPHDLLKIRDGRDLAGSIVQPDWVIAALRKAPFVVVRRSAFINQLVPVGVRGEMRNQRFASFLCLHHIVERIIPEELAVHKIWRKTPRLKDIGLFQVLELVDEFFTAEGLSWGPTGSVGFELASGVPTVTETSDLDMIIRAPQVLSVNIGKKLVAKLDKMAISMDVQLETPYGGVSLVEYARGNQPVLLRTIHGPKLVTDPWMDDKILER
jgi:phosphoribosyl-dephospho-CoA transferase